MKRTPLRRGKPIRKVSARQRKLKPIDDATRLRILARDGCRCVRCGQQWVYPYWLEVHHVHTRRTPSTRHADDNLATLCKALGRPNCHDYAGAHGKAFRAWWKERLAAK